jgi:hypothetical protein
MEAGGDRTLPLTKTRTHSHFSTSREDLDDPQNRSISSISSTFYAQHGHTMSLPRPAKKCIDASFCFLMLSTHELLELGFDPIP